MAFTRPVRFPGTDAEIAANRRTHYFVEWDEEVRCGDCDCRPFGTIATWPCGAKVPTETVDNTAVPNSLLELIARTA